MDQGTAEVRAKVGRAGSAGLVLAPSNPFSQARLSLKTGVVASEISFIDLYIRPFAGDRGQKEELIDVDSARVGFFKTDNKQQGALWIFNGDGKGGGLWLETGLRLPVNPQSGQCPDWHRLTIRADAKHQVWDLFLDGQWAAAGMGFQEPRVVGEATCIFMGDRRGQLALDDLLVSPSNPLTPDADADGLSDALEQSLGMNPQADDRALDGDGDGQSNLEAALAKLSLQAPAKPLAADAVQPVAVTLSRGSALVSEPVEVSVKLSGPVHELRYTLDGADPSEPPLPLGTSILNSRNTPSRTLPTDGSQGITVKDSAVLRVAALSAKGEVLGTACAAYLFPAEIAKFERPEGFPPQLFQSTVPVPLRYGSPVVGDKTVDAAAVDAALRAAPIVVLATSPDGWFHEASGVYAANATKLKSQVEVLVFAQGGKAVPKAITSAAVALSGEASLDHFITPKHSLRLKWTSPLGGAENDGALPAGSELLLRHPTHDSWVQNGERSRRRGGLYFADAFASAALERAGHASLSHHWVHVFLNGAYWGVYDAVEQVSPATTAVLLKGEKHGPVGAIFGQAARWNVLIAKLKSLYQLMQQGVATGDQWDEAAAQIDQDNLIDYILINIWMGTTDWPMKNFLITQAQPHAPFRFLSWDAEMALRGPQPGVSHPLTRVREAPDGPAAAFTRLAAWRPFRQRILTRARALFTAAGALSAESGQSALRAHAAAFRPLAAIEAARWTAQFDITDPSVLPAWEARVTALTDNYAAAHSASTLKDIESWMEQYDLAEKAAAARHLAASLRPQGPPAMVMPVAVVITDADADGLSDAWELQHKLDPNNPADAAMDSDKDGFSNREEYSLGLDPNKKNKPEDHLPPPETTVFTEMDESMIREGKAVERPSRNRGPRPPGTTGPRPPARPTPRLPRPPGTGDPSYPTPLLPPTLPSPNQARLSPTPLF